MSRVKLTLRVLASIPVPSKRTVLWDDELHGFGLRLEPSGSRSYIVRYRAEGGGRNAPQRFITLGSPDVLTPEDARKKARSIISAAVCGEDPAATLREARTASTVAELADLYMAEAVHMPNRHGTPMKATTIRSDRGRVENHIKPLLGTKRITSVTSRDVERFLVDVAHGKTRSQPGETRKRGGRTARGGQGAAKAATALLSCLFSYAKRLGLVKANPCQGVRTFATRKSERFLSTAELDRLGAAMLEAETKGIPWEPKPGRKVKHAPRPENRFTTVDASAVAAIRLLLLTGARMREILLLRWDYVDFERGILFLPDSKTGKKAIILNGPALAIIETVPRVGPYVIAGQDPAKPRSDLKRPWQTLCRRAGLHGVRIHDLRHTHASFGVALNFGLPVVGKLLGHAQPQTTARYAHLDNDPLRRASDAIGQTLADALSRVPDGFARRSDIELTLKHKNAQGSLSPDGQSDARKWHQPCCKRNESPLSSLGKRAPNLTMEGVRRLVRWFCFERVKPYVKAFASQITGDEPERTGPARRCYKRGNVKPSPNNERFEVYRHPTVFPRGRLKHHCRKSTVPIFV